MSRRTTTICYALLSVLLVASFALVVTPVNTKNKNRMANTTPEDDDNKVNGTRLLAKESGKLTYSRTFIAVTKAADYVTRYPNGGDTTSFLIDFDSKTFITPTFKSNPEFPIQGSSTFQKGVLCLCL